MSGALRFFLSLILVAGGAVALWWVQFRPQSPEAAQAQTSLTEQIQFSQISEGSAKDLLTQVDSRIAQVIRQVGAGQFSLPKFDVGSAMDTTVSAKISTTPDQFLKQMREEGAQAALGSVAQSVEMQVGEVSTEFVDQARYQYCKGVVETYESRR